MRADASPLLMFSWKKPFLPALKQMIMEQTGGKPGSALVITPNKRPWRYFVDVFRQERKPLTLPKMMPVKEMTALWRAWSFGMPKHEANVLDQVGLLWECVHRVAKNDPALASRFAQMSIADFLPWGLRLQALLEELFLQGKRGLDIQYAEDDAISPASDLLSALGRIYQEWQVMLEEKGWTTEGFDNCLAAQNIDDIPEFLRPGPGRQVFIAGFSTLNGVQDRLFRKLWENGAQVCLHGSMEVLARGGAANPCRPLQEWANNWSTRIEPVDVGAEEPGEPTYHFYAAYDAHSQLARLRENLLGGEAACASTAIVLPNSSMLMPVLHELPDKQVNISMGYPLIRATLSEMLERLFRPRQYQREDGLVYWREALALVNLPFWGMLKPESSYAAGLSFRDTLRKLDGEIRSGKPYVDLVGLVEKMDLSLPDSHRDLLRKSFQAFVEGPANIRTLAGLAASLESIIGVIIRYGGEIIEKFPLDAEALARLQESIIPLLRHNELSGEELPQKALYGVLCDLLNEERIAFEADPLVGVQILGLLETRLLNFDHVYILDAADDILPGRRPQDPLLPDSLRPALGLPNAATRHAIAGYNLFRLCAGARDVHFYWPEGMAATAVGGGRNFRSRFVEQLIWQIESGLQKDILKPGQGILQVANSSAVLCRRRNAPIARDQAITEAINGLQAGNLSATMLTAYLKCPQRFMLTYLFRLQNPVEVEEGDNALLTGECLHKAMQDFFSPRIGKTLHGLADARDELLQCWNARYASEGLIGRLPPASCIALEMAAPQCLEKFAAGFPPETRIVACEEQEHVSLSLYKNSYSFTCRMDRIDRRSDGYHILDYKTGKGVSIDKAFWGEDEYFDRLAAYMDSHEAFDADADEMLQALSSRMNDVQLPLYMLAGAEKFKEIPANAALVHMGGDAIEVALLSDDIDREKAMRNFRIAIEFVLRHMAEIPEFGAWPDDGGCKLCRYQGCCF